jgi:hypothetical protein
VAGPRPRPSVRLLADVHRRGVPAPAWPARGDHDLPVVAGRPLRGRVPRQLGVAARCDGDPAGDDRALSPASGGRLRSPAASSDPAAPVDSRRRRDHRRARGARARRPGKSAGPGFARGEHAPLVLREPPPAGAAPVRAETGPSS